MTQILIPLKQHVGAPCKAIVKADDRVQRGQLIAEPNGLGANIHASFSGRIIDVDENNIALMIDEEQNFSTYLPITETDSPIKAVENAGIVGSGGAGFPTFLKLAC